MAWNKMLPADNSALSSAELRDNWDAIDANVLHVNDGLVGAYYNITNLPERLTFQYDICAAGDPGSGAAIVVKNKGVGASGSSTGLSAEALGLVGDTIDYHTGLFGKAAGASYNYGVRGRGYYSVGKNYGVYGEADGSTTGNYGVRGQVGGSTSHDYAIYGYGGGADSYSGYFTNGRFHINDVTTITDATAQSLLTVTNSRSSGDTYAIKGLTDGGSSGIQHGVYGESDSGNKVIGVYGNAINGSDQSIGVYGISDDSSDQNIGIYGKVTGNSSDDYAIRGYSGGGNSYSGYFANGLFYISGYTGIGVLPTETYGLNVQKTNVVNQSYGVYSGISGAVTTVSAALCGSNNCTAPNNYGVHGTCSGAGTTNYGVYASAQSATTNYGLYTTVTGNTATDYAVYGYGGGTSSYSGYFSHGKFHVNGEATIAYSTVQDLLTVTNSRVGNAYAIKGIVDGVVSGVMHRGVYGKASGSDAENIGLFGEVSGAGAIDCAIYGNGGGTDSYAGRFINGRISMTFGRTAANNTSGNASTLNALNASATDVGCAITGRATGSGGSTHYGVYGQASGATNNYGIYGTVAGATTGCIAIYGDGGGAGGLAGCFANGPVKVYDDFSANGYVATGGATPSTVMGIHANKSNIVANSYGIYNDVTGSNTSNYGIFNIVRGATTNYGSYNSVTGSGTTNYGVYATVENGISDYGIYGKATHIGGTSHYGVWGEASGATNNIGLYGKTGGNTNTSYALYCSGGSGNSYAGYFNSGKIRMNGSVDDVASAVTGALTYITNNSTSSVGCGLYASVIGAGGTKHYGAYGAAGGAASNYGVYGSIVGTDATDYAIYGEGGGGNSYAGYFSGHLYTTGNITAVNDFYQGANQGKTGTLTLDDGANWRITLTFSGGILTSHTEGGTVAATAVWA